MPGTPALPVEVLPPVRRSHSIDSNSKFNQRECYLLLLLFFLFFLGGGGYLFVCLFVFLLFVFVNKSHDQDNVLVKRDMASRSEAKRISDSCKRFQLKNEEKKVIHGEFLMYLTNLIHSLTGCEEGFFFFNALYY